MCPEQARARLIRPGARLLCLIALFVAGLLPSSQSFFHWYTDERRYTNAAIVMVGTGGYTTPRWFDGSPRLRKPVRPYWLVAARYRMFGIYLWAGRLPFILAGALVIALTYRTAPALTGDPETAMLAAAIMFSHPQLILASIRSIPDVVQRADPALKARVLRYQLALVLAAFATLGLALSWLAAAAPSGGRPLVVLVSFVGVAAALAVAVRLHRLSPATAGALAVFLAFPMVELTLRPIFEPDAGTRVIAQELEGLRADALHPALLAGSDALAGEIRILTQGRLVIIPWSRIEPAPESWPEAMILPAEQARRLDLVADRTRGPPRAS
jgi:hypothetical protein